MIIARIQNFMPCEGKRTKSDGIKSREPTWENYSQLIFFSVLTQFRPTHEETKIRDAGENTTYCLWEQIIFGNSNTSDIGLDPRFKRPFSSF